MAQDLGYLRETPSQTAGPYVHIGLAPGAAGFQIYDRELGQVIAAPDVPGQRVRIEGRVIDGLGAAVKDVLIEVWHADSNGTYAQDPHQVAAGFRGWGRVIPDFDSGLFAFDTIRPGANGGQAPHINFWLVARGINIGLNTRMYFPDDGDSLSADPVLNSIEHPARRQTLIAVQIAPGHYRFDIRLQGADETVFMDI